MVGLQQACSSLELSGKVNRVHVKAFDLAASPALLHALSLRNFLALCLKWVTACTLTCFDSL